MTDAISATASSGLEDESFLKKYGNVGMEERRRDLEDLRATLDLLNDPSQSGKATPEALSELKREIGWLESHSDD